jgi:membrane protein
MPMQPGMHHSQAMATAGAPRTTGERSGLIEFASRTDPLDLARRTARDVGEADVPGLAAEMAYHSLFALFAFLLLLAGLTSAVDELFRVDNMRERLVDSAKDVLPQNASLVVEAFLNDVVDSQGQGAIIFGLAGVAWAGSNVVGSAMKGLNRIARTDDHRGMVERKLLAIGLALALGSTVVLASVIVVFRSSFADGLEEALGSRPAAEFVMTVVAWPIALMLITLAAAVLYWKGPDREASLRWVTPGALLFAAGWVVASIVASIYVSYVGAPNRTYGLITAIIVAIVWLYWSNLLFLAGAILNAHVEDHQEHGGTGERAEQPADAQP